MLYPGKPILNPENCTLLVGIGPESVDLYPADLDLEAKRRGFQKKTELHITVLGFKASQLVREALEKMPDKETAIEEIINIADNMDWSFEIKPERFFVSKEERESIIQMVELDSIYPFIERLSGLLNTKFPIPPAHITLYTKGSDEKSHMGIGINSQEEFEQLNPRPVILGPEPSAGNYTKIILPTRPQPDTIVAIFILKKFGETIFPGIKEATIDFWQVLPENENEKSLDKQGVILIDLGGGRFDHHGTRAKTTASDLVSSYLGVFDDPALAKLLEYARRDDFFGKGTVSNDPLDRAFGLSSLIAVLNKSLVKNPAKVVEIILPILAAHYNEELRRTKELPKEFEDILAKGEAEMFTVKQRDKKLKAVIVSSENSSLAGYLRSQNGGKFDVVAQWLSSGHVNILTRPTKRIDLRSLAAILRLEEATTAGSELTLGIRELSRPGRIKEIPEWYYDPATNSIQNGCLNPKEISPTKIPKDKFRKLVELGLSEQLWSPRA